MAVSFNVSAGDTITRSEFNQQCNITGTESGGDYRIVGAVCNRSSQLISYVKTEKASLQSDFTLKTNSEYDVQLANGAIEFCLGKLEENQYTFMQYFGTLDASIR